MNEILKPIQSMGPGIARAVVRANQDPEKLGRIRVEYPWFHGEAAQLPSEWARLCRSYASAESGEWWIPEIGDEVLVAFENGNLDHPFVLGSLFSPKNPPPKSERAGDLNEDGANALKFIRTKSGHRLIFDDSTSQRGIVIRDRENRRLEIRSQDRKIVLSDEKNNSVSISSEQIEVANANGTRIRLKGSEIEIQAAGEIKIGSGSLHALVKGDLFQQLFNAHCHPTPTGQSGPPATPMTPDMLSQKVKSA